MLNGWFSSIDVICADNHNYFQFKLKGNGRSGAATQVVDVPVVLLQRCCSSVDGLTFGRVHRYTARGSPTIRAGKGWRGRRELAPRCSATRIRCIVRTRQDRLAVSLIIRTTSTTHFPTQIVAPTLPIFTIVNVDICIRDQMCVQIAGVCDQTCVN